VWRGFVITVPDTALGAWVMLQSLRLLRRWGRWFKTPQWLVDFEVKLTHTVGLFDREHYLAQVEPASLAGMTPVRHYVLFGDRQGHTPSPLFDNHHYDAHCGSRHGLNRLLHYGLVTRFRKRSPTPWFDVEYYLRSNPDVARAGMDPLVHFQRYGWRDGRMPLPGLDLRRLMESRPELRVVRGHALSMLTASSMQALLQASAQVQPRGPNVTPMRCPMCSIPRVGRLCSPGSGRSFRKSMC